MSTYSILIVIQYVSLLLLTIEAAFIIYNWKTRIQGLLFFSVIVTLINNLGYLLEMLAVNDREYMASLKMSYLGRSWIPFALLLFVLNACEIRYSKKLTAGLALIHLLTFMSVLTCEKNSIYYTTKTYVQEGLFPHYEFGHGPWYITYDVILFAYIVYGISNLFIKVKNETNSIAKKRYIMVTISITVECIAFVLGFTNLTGCYDPTVLGYTVGAVFMCVAIFKYKLLDTLTVAREYVVEEIPEAIFVYDQDGIVEYTNNAACGLFSEDTSGKEIALCIEESIKTGEPMELNGRIWSAEKKKLSHDGVVHGKVYVLVDDTEHYNYMSKLREQKELAEAAKEEAIAMSESKSAFLSVVSHEIRTPMNAVVGMTDLLLREPENLTDKQEKYLRNIKNSGSALVMIVNDILDQSKIEAGKMEIIEGTYELRPMLEDVMMIIENRVGTKPIKVDTQVGDDIPQYLIGDSLRIRQILINLMNNAVKFTEEGSICLSIERQNIDGTAENGLDPNKIHIRFAVKDSGQGIKPEDLSRLGEAFSQVDIKKNHGKEGTGLGLNISKNFISLMGGQLQVDSVYGEGSEFYFCIEQGVGEALSNNEDQVVSKQAWEQEEKFVCPEASILVVDDTEINLMLMTEMFKPLKAKVDTASSGEKAIELVKKNHYDVIFMDYMMPYMNGIETTKVIRGLTVEDMKSGDESQVENVEEHIHHYTIVPIIALTADDSEDTKTKFAEAGINDFVEKPVILPRLKKILIDWNSDKIERA